MKSTKAITTSMSETIAWHVPAWLLRLEGAAELAAAVLLYAQLQFSWLTFLLVFFLPDAALVVYAVNKRAGILTYNLLHTLTLPIVLCLAAAAWSWSFGLQIGLIWAAHIGLDRLFGYGLKYPDNFMSTHFSRL
jgi:hypothetical protein